MTSDHSSGSLTRRAAITFNILLALVATLVIAAPAGAEEASAGCSNGYGDEMQLLSGDFGLPLWLGVQPGLTGVLVCYGTGAPDDPKLLGGHVKADIGQVGKTFRVFLQSDSNAGAGANVELIGDADPAYTVSPGGTSGGQVATIEIPFSVCSGACYPSSNSAIGTTGLVVGQISQRPAGPGGVSAAYSVSSLCLYVDGIPVTSCGQPVDLPGVTTTGADPVQVSTGGGPASPCVLVVCIPVDYVGTSGSQLATVYLPGLSPIPVNGVSVCAYHRDATQCPG